MHGKLLGAALALYVTGCSESAPATRPRGLLVGEETHAAVIAPAPATPPPVPPPAPPRSLSSPFESKLDPGALAGPAALQDDGQPVQAAPEVSVVDAGKPRDLAAELSQRLGSPTSCLDLQSVVEGGGQLTVLVVAEVMPSGRITRAQATAPGQPSTALRCLEARATAASLKGPVPSAPVSVSATFPIEVAAQPTLGQP